MSLVALTFRNTRVLGVPVPYQQEYVQVNLRFYVRRGVEGGARRGLVFLEAVVPNPLLALGTRLLYHENYVAAPTDLSVSRNGERTDYRYTWEHTLNRRNAIQGRVERSAQPCTPGSFEDFLTHRLWSYTAQPGRMVAELQVEHPRWNVAPLTGARLELRDNSLREGIFDTILKGEPDSTFFADGSAVDILPPHRFRASPRAA